MNLRAVGRHPSHTMAQADYPRPHADPGDADRLRALADGYFRLLPAFAGTFLAGYPIQVALILGFNGLPILIPATFAATTLVVAALTIGPLRRIGRGAGWHPAAPAIAALTLGLTAPLCCGALGFPVAMAAATRRMRRLGVRIGFFGPSRQDVYERFRVLASGPTLSLSAERARFAWQRHKSLQVQVRREDFDSAFARRLNRGQVGLQESESDL